MYLLYFMLMRKNLIYGLLKNKTWQLIMFLFALIALQFIMQRLHYKFNNLAIRRKNSRKKGMVFKPSFKCLKNKKINFSPAFLKLETLLYQSIYIYIISSYIIFAERFWFKKKKWSTCQKKTCQIKNRVICTQEKIGNRQWKILINLCYLLLWINFLTYKLF